jgi:CBS domain-containing protein
MQCSELMKTNVRIANAQSTVADAAVIMRDCNVGFLPVCDIASGEILGTITDRDIAIRLVAENMPSDTKIAELATPETIFCRTDSDVEQAHQLMRENHVARLLCVDDSGRLAGVISLSDIASRMPELAADTLRELSKRDLDLI